MIQALPAERHDMLPPQARQEHTVPRYFFHVKDGRSIPDDVGIELPDIQAAQAQAVTGSAEILRDEGSQFWDGTDWRMTVTDERGHILFVLRFSAEELPNLVAPAH
jgi:hypothetical protein